jgi:hypothetical protein
VGHFFACLFIVPGVNTMDFHANSYGVAFVFPGCFVLIFRERTPRIKPLAFYLARKQQRGFASTNCVILSLSRRQFSLSQHYHLHSRSTMDDRRAGSTIARTIYEILRRLGLKYVGSKYGRPNFPDPGKIVKRFYWQTHGEVYLEFRDGKISRATALSRTTSITNEFGPLIWGANRSSLVAAQKYPEYPKDLYWADSEETRDLYVYSHFTACYISKANTDQHTKSSS